MSNCYRGLVKTTKGKGPLPSLEDSKIVKIRAQLLQIFLRATGPTSCKLDTK